VSDLEEYVEKQLTPEKLNEIQKKRYFELEFAQPNEEDFSKSTTELIYDKLESVEALISGKVNGKIDVLLKGFDSQIIPIKDLGSFHRGHIVKIICSVSTIEERAVLYAKTVWKCKNCGFKLELNYERSDPFNRQNPNNQIACHEIVDKYMKNGKEKVKRCNCTRWVEVADEHEVWDLQKMVVQELPESVQQLPKTIDGYIINLPSLVNYAFFGQTISVIGILRSMSSSKTSNLGNVWFLDIKGIEVLSKSSDISDLSKKDIEDIQSLIKDPDFYRRFVINLSPSHKRDFEIKEGIAHAIVGGVEKEEYRDIIHLLLTGDPASGKSSLLESTVQRAPFAYFTSCKTSTGVGLTASMGKKGNGKNEKLVLQAGAMVMANNGVLALDEIDKMDPNERGAIHTAMESLKVVRNVAGAMVNLPARTTIIANGNPINSRYDPKLSIADNLKGFLLSFLDRFDLIYCMIERNPEIDRAMVKNEEEAKPIGIDMMKKIFTYMKSFKPRMSNEAIDIIGTEYLKRREEEPKDTLIIWDKRKYRALWRLAESHAKMQFKDVVDSECARKAIEMIDFSMSTFKNTPSTKSNPSDISMGDKEKVIYDTLRKYGFGTEEKLLHEAVQQSFETDEEFKEVLMKLYKDGKILQPQEGWYQAI
jgi:replicative DNA helicase Mcm